MFFGGGFPGGMPGGFGGMPGGMGGGSGKPVDNERYYKVPRRGCWVLVQLAAHFQLRSCAGMHQNQQGWQQRSSRRGGFFELVATTAGATAHHPTSDPGRE